MGNVGDVVAQKWEVRGDGEVVWCMEETVVVAQVM